MTSSQPLLVAHVVLAHRRRDNRALLLVAGPAAPDLIERDTRLPAFEDVNAIRLNQVGTDREVEAAWRLSGLPHDRPAVFEVAVALQWVDDEVTRDDQHWLLLRLTHTLTV